MAPAADGEGDCVLAALIVVSARPNEQVSRFAFTICDVPLVCSSLHLFDVRKLPSFVEEGFVRIVQAKSRKPGAAWRSRYPVRLLSGRRLGAEVNVHRAIGVFLHRRAIRIEADHRRFADKGVCKTVVSDDRPILLCRNIGGNVQLVGMLAADRLAATVTERDKINNAPTLPHPFGKPKGGEVGKATRIHVQSDVRHVAEVSFNAPLVGKRPGSVLPPALAKGL